MKGGGLRIGGEFLSDKGLPLSRENVVYDKGV
jgi:hypothetical protein